MRARWSLGQKDWRSLQYKTVGPPITIKQCADRDFRLSWGCKLSGNFATTTYTGSCDIVIFVCSVGPRARSAARVVA